LAQSPKGIEESLILVLSFIDANVFLYAFLKPKRKLQEHEEEIKDAAKRIVTRINNGEQVVTSVVHLSEICNILEDFLPVKEALELERSLLFLEGVVIKEVSEEDYLKAFTVAEDEEIGANDVLAYVLMKEEKINRIYSFDKHFDSFKDIQRITE
jgi:predicted nucleic acid-binding protein